MTRDNGFARRRVRDHDPAGPRPVGMLPLRQPEGEQRIPASGVVHPVRPACRDAVGRLRRARQVTHITERLQRRLARLCVILSVQIRALRPF